MKTSLPNKARIWGLALLPWVLSLQHSPAQFLEVSAQIEGTFWTRTPSGERTERRQTYTAHCVFGTNTWWVEGDFSANATEIYWCTGTNILKLTQITKELPESGQNRRASFLAPGPPLHIGDRFTTLYRASDPQPLYGIANLAWLAFCSGPFLKVDGRRIVPPFNTPAEGRETSDKIQVFNDSLGLPNRAEIYSPDKALICVYEVRQSTNLAGWTVPLQFEFKQYRARGHNTPEPFLRALGTVISIQRGTELKLPPEFVKRLAR